LVGIEIIGHLHFISPTADKEVVIGHSFKYPAVLIFLGSLLSLPLLFPAKPLSFLRVPHTTRRRGSGLHRQGRAFKQKLAAWGCTKVF
jgi:hypothetical protein